MTQEIYQTATDLFTALGLQRARIRLVGVRVEGLVPRATVQRQLVLGERERGWSEADGAVDRATPRFGRRRRPTGHPARERPGLSVPADVPSDGPAAGARTWQRPRVRGRTRAAVAGASGG